MAKPKAMTESELIALTDSEMRNSLGFYGGMLAEQRRKAEYYYLGLAKGDLAPPEIEGRSKVVSPDVRNTIEAMLPQLMVKFTGGDKVVEFEPQQPGDEETASQVTDYLSYLFFKKNNGHSVTYTMFKDALLQKRGIVKVWWDDRHEETKEEYRGLSDVELSEILDDKELEPISHSTRVSEEDQQQREEAIKQLTEQLQQAQQAAQPSPQAPQGNPQAMQAVQQLTQQIQGIQAQPPMMLHDLECKRTKTQGKVKIENVPPEEFLISRKAKNIEEASFVGHRVARTMSDLRSMGYKNIDDISSDDSVASFNAERVERLSFDDEMAYLNIDNRSSDESQRQVWVTECYVRCDFDGDGISELRKVVRAGNQILDNEVVDVVPFVSVCPIPLPHKFFGLSIADVGFDAQLTKTGLLRAKIDNTFLEANGRYFAVDGQVNLDDLLTSRPGGVVRIKQPGAVGRLDQGVGANNTNDLLEYMEGFLESSTGWTRQSQGNSAGSLQGTATGMNIITNKDDMRVDLIARNFAEGFVDLFKLMLKLVCQHQQQAAEMRLNGQWLKLNPSEWRNQFDVSINVGLGVGNKDQRIQHLMALRQQQDVGMQFGVANPLNVYNANAELAKELGYRNADKFFTDPSKNPPPQHADPEAAKMQGQMQIEQMKIQADAQKHQAQTQQDQQKFQAESQMQMQVEQMKAELKLKEIQASLELQAANDARDSEREQQKAIMDAQLAQQQIEFDKWKAEFDAQTKIYIEEMKVRGMPPSDAMQEQSNMTQVLQGLQAVIAQMSAPKVIVRGADGRAIGVQHAQG